MRFEGFVFLTAAVLQPTLAQSYLDLTKITQFYVTGASLDWNGLGTNPQANTANGPNHIEYLTENRGWTIHQYAFPGAVTDANIVPSTASPSGFPAPVVNWNAQIAKVMSDFSFDKAGKSNQALKDNFLFVLSASNTGNDILNSWNTAAGSPGSSRTNTINLLLDKLIGGLNNVYANGGRNFIFYSVVPVHRIPKIQTQGSAAVNSVKAYVEEYNAALKNRIVYARAVYPDANIYFPEFTQKFYDIVDGKVTTGPTGGYQVRNNFCAAVADNRIGLLTTRQPDYNCFIPARTFLWWDDIHPTSPLHCEYAYQTLFTLVGFAAKYPASCQCAAGSQGAPAKCT